MRDAGPCFDFGDGIVARHVPGDGERVLWIHGYTMDSSVWGELWARLPAWDHLGLDLPGHGASRPLRADDDLPTLARRVGELALAHGVRHVCALSFGTILALQMSMESGSALGSAVLAAPALAGGPEDAAVAARYRELALLYRQKGSGPHMAELWLRSPPVTFKGLDARPGAKRLMAELAGRHTWRELEDLSMLRLTSPPQTEDRVRTIESDVLVLVGTDDMPAFKQCADSIVEWTVSSRRVDLTALGHLCILEAPEIVAPLIHDHLAANTRMMGRTT